MDQHEHDHEGVQRASDGVLDTLMLPMERAYLMTLTKINATISSALRRSERLVKSDGGIPLFVSAGAASDLFKAVKPTPAKKPKAAPSPKKPAPQPKAAKLPKSKAQVAAEREPTKAENAGSRGSTRWYIDKHGNVRYGTRPSQQGDRFTDTIPDAELSSLHKKLEVVAGFDPVLDHWIAEHLNIADWDASMMDTLREAAFNSGMSMEQLVVEGLQEAGESEEDAKEAWGRMVNSLQAAVENPDLLKRAQNVVATRKRRERDASKAIEATEDLTKNFHKDFLTGETEDASLRTLGLLIEYGALFMPKRNEAVGTEATAGELRTDDHVLESIGHFRDSMTPGQVLAWAVGDRLRQVINSKGAEDAEELGFRDENGELRVDLADRVALPVEEAMERALKREMTDKERAQVHEAINLVAEDAYKQVHELNNFEGGEAISMMFRDELTAHDLFKDKNALKAVKQRVEENRKLRKDAVAARENPNIELSKAMEVGFEAITKELQAAGKLKKGEKAGLFEYQKKMVNWMLTIKKGLLAADTGLGKTPMLIAAVSKLLEEKKTKRAILVLPKGLVKQWPKEIKRFMPDAQIVTLGEGMSPEERLDIIEAVNSGELKCDFMVMSASTVDFTAETKKELAKLKTVVDPDTGELRKVGPKSPEYQAKMAELRKSDRLASALRSLEGALVFDEMHSAQQGLKSRYNVHYHVAKEMMKGREYAWGMTATPMPNGQPKELFTELNLIHPGSCGESLARFENSIAQYRDVVDPNTGKVKREFADFSDWTEMSEHLAPVLYSKKKTDDDVRETQKSMGQELRDANHMEHTLAMSADMEKLYAQAGMFTPHDKIGDPEYKPWHKLNAIGRMGRVLDQKQKMALSPRLLFGNDPAKWPKGYDGSQPKVEHLADLALKHFNAAGNEGRPMIVFSSFPSVFELVKEELIKRGVDPSLIGEIHGGVKNDDRDVIAEAVNHQEVDEKTGKKVPAGKIKICLVGVQAGGAGLNLQKNSKTMVFLDKPWRPADVDQAVGRVHRTGQSELVDVFHMKLQGAIDEGKLEGLRMKITTIEAAQFAGLGEDYLGDATRAMVLKLTGSSDESGAQKSREEIQQALTEMGLKNQSTPGVLKEQFDIMKFGETQDFKQWAEFGGQYIDQMRTVNETRKRQGKIDAETYLRKKRAIAKQELAWKAVVEFAKNTEIAKEKPGKSKQPSQEYVAFQGKNKFEAGTMEHEIMDAMINKQVRTPEDLVEQVIAPVVARNAPEDHVETIKPKLIAMAKRKFEDLVRTGHIVPRTGAGDEEGAPHPKGKKTAPKGAGASEKGSKKPTGKAPKGGKTAPAPKKAAPAAPKKDDGTYKVVGSAAGHRSLNAQAKAVWSEIHQTKAKSIPEFLKKRGYDVNDPGINAALKKYLKTFRSLGLIE